MDESVELVREWSCCVLLKKRCEEGVKRQLARQLCTNSIFWWDGRGGSTRPAQLAPAAEN